MTETLPNAWNIENAQFSDGFMEWTTVRPTEVKDEV